MVEEIKTRIKFTCTVCLLKEAKFHHTENLRSGVILYNNGYCYLGQDRQSNLLTNFAGGPSSKYESPAECAIRECTEETLGLVIPDKDKLLNSVCVYSPTQVIIFYQMDVTNDLISEFAYLAEKTEKPEIKSIVRVNLDDFLGICADKNQTKMFRPVAITIRPVINSLRSKLVGDEYEYDDIE